MADMEGEADPVEAGGEEVEHVDKQPVKPKVSFGGAAGDGVSSGEDILIGGDPADATAFAA